MVETISVRVGEIRDVAVDIKVLELLPETGPTLPAFEAGSHIDLHLGNSIVRQYSLCGDPHGPQSRYLIAVKKEPDSRGGSSAAHSLLQGQKIEISHPRNNFRLTETSGRNLLIAGGIGVTPMIAMAHTLHKTQRNFELHYFTRSISHTAFREQILLAPFAGRVRFYHGVEGDELKEHLYPALKEREAHDHLYLCGPQPFMDAVRSLMPPDWPATSIHVEYFSPRDRAGSIDAGFVVKLSSDDRIFEIPADKTIAQVLEENGKQIDLSCCEGVCGTCITTVLEGVPDHRDQILTDAEKQEGRKMTICCSRALSPMLVLDL